MKNIKKLKFWGLYEVLLEKYRLRETEALALADFLLKMLRWEPKDRASAQEMLGHHWLKMIPNYNTKMSRAELREFLRTKNRAASQSSEDFKDEINRQAEEEEKIK